MGDTRRERDGKVRSIFGPIRRMIADLKQGEVDSIRGYPIIRAWGENMDLSDSLRGMAECFTRIAPGFDAEAFELVAKRLENGVFLEVCDVERLEAALNNAEAVYRVTPLEKVKSATVSAMIARQVKEMGIAA